MRTFIVTTRELDKDRGNEFQRLIRAENIPDLLLSQLDFGWMFDEEEDVLSFTEGQLIERVKFHNGECSEYYIISELKGVKGMELEEPLELVEVLG